MKRVIGATVIAALSCVVVTAQTAPSRSPQRNVVLDWNRIVMTTVGIRNGVEQVRIAAIAHLAIFEAVNAVAGDFTPYLEIRFLRRMRQSRQPRSLRRIACS